MEQITTRESEILNLILRGFETPEIKKKMGIGEATVQSIRTCLLKKFKSKTTIGMIVQALKYGFMSESIELFKSEYDYIRESDYLTLNEVVVIHAVLNGRTSRQIGRELSLTVRTIEGHRQKVNEKWGVDSKVDLVLKADQKGYLSLASYNEDLNIHDQDQVWAAFKKSLKLVKSNKYHPVYKISFSHPNYTGLTLSKQLRKVLKLRLSGVSNTEISEQIGVQLFTVQRYMTKAKKKLEVRTISDLIIKSLALGIITILPRPKQTIKTLTQFELSILLLLAESLSYKQISDVQKTNTYVVLQVVTKLKSEWNTKTIEGLIVEALNRGEISLDMISE